VLDPLPQLTIALMLAALFGASAIQKLLMGQEWLGVVRNYRLVPERISGAVATAAWCAEGLTAAALLWAPTQRAGACATAGLLIAYAAAIGINLKRGRTSIDCGCIAFGRRPGIAAWMVWRNIVLTLLALILLLPTIQRPLSVAEIAVAVACVVTLAFLYPVLAVVFRPPPPTFDENFHARTRAGR
jgi:hypothetical protein